MPSTPRPNQSGRNSQGRKPLLPTGGELSSNAELQIVSYYYEERYDRDSYGLFVYYDSQCNPTVGDWELLSD